MAPDKLKTYQGKRDFAATPEPAGGPDGSPSDAPRFVVQEHHATRLHWDLRLEHDGVAVSWALPNGVPATPQENRLAVHTEDHPLEYLEFEGDIPKGEYGAGKMRIWDRGTFEVHKFDDRKVEITFHGERLHGRYGLFPLGHRAGAAADGKDDWMIHRMDPPQDPEREPIPERLVPMMARSGDLPPDERGWSFEVKWDGVRAIAYLQPGRIRLESRNLREITDSYPEIRGITRDLGMREAVLDGEIVAFDENGKPSFERLQRRMHVTSSSSVRKLAQSTPVVYAIFDLLYLDGHSLMEQPYAERRVALEELNLSGPAWRVPAAHSGDGVGARLLEMTGAQGLEGLVAKRVNSKYEPGRRSGAWVKVKHTRRQELVIGGWLPGEGRRRDSIGALLMGSFEDGGLRYVGRVGTGFTEKTLTDLKRRLKPLHRPDSPFAAGPKLPREAQFAEPQLVAEIEFREWTSEGVMRAPSYKGLRDDKPAQSVHRESKPDELFDAVEPLPDGARAVTVDGRRLKITNWDKVLYPQTGFTKGDLVEFYARIAPAVLPHLRDRALTLKRYPNGVEGQYFYEKNSPAHRPDWIPTANIGGVRYTLCQERATLVWLANLADIELHTSLSLAAKPEQPTMVVFDLDPGAPAGIVECCEVALVLRGLFEQFGATSFVKTSGSKGMQMYVPLNTPITYEQSKPFARRIAEALEQRMPKLVTSRMTKQLRSGKVLVDWSQNDEHKTTVTVYSVRARERPTVSTPVTWEEVAACRERGEPELLTFDTKDLIERLEAQGDLFAPLLSTQQKLPGLRR